MDRNDDPLTTDLEADEIANQVIYYSCDTFYAYITKQHRLVWGDWVANEWAEQYEYLSTATARLSLLMYCDEEDVMFTGSQDEFLKEFIKMRRATVA